MWPHANNTPIPSQFPDYRTSITLLKTISVNYPVMQFPPSQSIRVSDAEIFTEEPYLINT